MRGQLVRCPHCNRDFAVPLWEDAPQTWSPRVSPIRRPRAEDNPFGCSTTGVVMLIVLVTLWGLLAFLR
jgi:hypothetical protein